MSGIFDCTLPDGTPAPVFRMDNVRAVEHAIAVAAEDAARIADVYAEQRRNEEARQRHEDIQRGESELAYLRQQSRAAARAAGDDGPDRLRAAFIESVRRDAERLGLPFEVPQEAVIEAPEPPKRNLGDGPSHDGAELSNLRQRFVAAVLTEKN